MNSRFLHIESMISHISNKKDEPIVLAKWFVFLDI